MNGSFQAAEQRGCAWRDTSLEIEEKIELTYPAKAAAKRRMNISQYAEHRGCSRQAVYKAMDEGRITREPDGSIDPVKADRQWADNTCPASRWATSREDIVLSPADLARILDA